MHTTSKAKAVWKSSHAHDNPNNSNPAQQGVKGLEKGAVLYFNVLSPVPADGEAFESDVFVFAGDKGLDGGELRSRPSDQTTQPFRSRTVQLRMEPGRYGFDPKTPGS